MNRPRKVHVKSFGCQMNVYDSHRMADTLAPEGYVETQLPAEADLIILNTCHIREKAVDKVYSEIGRMRELKDQAEIEGRKMLIAVAGCVAQAEGEEIIRRTDSVDVVVGSQNYHKLPALLTRALDGEKIVDTEFPLEDKFDALAQPTPQAITKRGISAFVTVQEGCDKFCTFCVVPYTRGAEISRPVAKVLADVERLAANGVREISLIGQNVNAYHGADSNGDAVTLGALMRRIAQVPGIARLRYMTSHPRDMLSPVCDDLIAAHGDLPELMPYVHLPVQAGSDRILGAMNRKHTRKDYMQAIARLRKARPDIAFTSDFIVGFPGETEEDFRETLALAEDVNFVMAYTFSYSPRPGTPAAKIDDQVPNAEKHERLLRLQAVIDRQWKAFNGSFAGKTMEILVEKPGKLTGQLVGRSPYLQSVHVMAAPSLIGQIVPVRITDIGTNTLFGELALSSPPPERGRSTVQRSGGGHHRDETPPRIAKSDPTLPLPGRVETEAGA